MRTFPRGYKQYKVLEMVEHNKPMGSARVGSASYTEIIKFSYELSYGEGTYSNYKRGYWSAIFRTPQYDGYPWSNKKTGWAHILMCKSDLDGKYRLSKEGRDKLFIYQRKWGTISPEKISKEFEDKKLEKKLKKESKNVTNPVKPIYTNTRVECSNGLTIPESPEKKVSTIEPIRGLDLDDKVIIYNTATGDVIDGIVTSTCVRKEKNVCSTCDEIWVNIRPAGPRYIYFYNHSINQFTHNGIKVEIIKLPPYFKTN